MQEIQIIKIVFGIFLTIFSVVLFIIAFKIYYKYLIQEKRCKAKTKGIVKKYTLANRGGEHSGVLWSCHFIFFSIYNIINNRKMKDKD